MEQEIPIREKALRLHRLGYRVIFVPQSIRADTRRSHPGRKADPPRPDLQRGGARWGPSLTPVRWRGEAPRGKTFRLWPERSAQGQWRL